MQDLLKGLSETFSLNSNAQVISRENEIESIKKFINNCIDKNKGSALYVCGQPGTGKSMTTTSILSDISRTSKKCQVIYINCMGFKDKKEAYISIYKLLTKTKNVTISISEIIKQLESMFFDQSSKKMMCIVLDEVDQLISRTNEDLYRIFEWPFEKQSKLILIGIANALDLVQRSLPRLSSCGREPALLHFTPYNRDQIYRILYERIESITDPAICEEEALVYCAKQVEVNNGDIRKALDICRQLVSIKQVDFKRQEKEDLDEDEYIISLDDMMDVIDNIFGQQNTSKIKNLPLHGQLIVISSFTSSTSISNIIFGDLFKAYNMNCKLISIDPVYKNEFYDVLSSITSTGLMTLDTLTKIENQRRITLHYNKDEALFALSHLKILKPLLSYLREDEEEEDEEDDNQDDDDEPMEDDESE